MALADFLRKHGWTNLREVHPKTELWCSGLERTGKSCKIAHKRTNPLRRHSQIDNKIEQYQQDQPKSIQTHQKPYPIILNHPGSLLRVHPHLWNLQGKNASQYKWSWIEDLRWADLQVRAYALPIQESHEGWGLGNQGSFAAQEDYQLPYWWAVLALHSNIQ